MKRLEVTCEFTFIVPDDFEIDDDYENVEDLIEDLPRGTLGPDVQAVRMYG